MFQDYAGLFQVFGSNPDIEEKTAEVVRREATRSRSASDCHSLDAAKAEIRRLRGLLRSELDYHQEHNFGKTPEGARVSICGRYTIDEDGSWLPRDGK